MTQHPQQPQQPQYDRAVERILRFIDDLQTDPHAVPPSDLDAGDIALARDLARRYTRPVLDDARREGIWQRVLADAVRQRLAQRTPLAPDQSHAHTNGRHARQETESMFTQKSAVTQPMPLQRIQHKQPRSRGIWITGLVAAVSALVIGGLLFAGLGDSPPPEESASGAGIPVFEQAITPTFGDTVIPPMIQAVMDIDVRQGPGLDYPVTLTLTEGGIVSVIGQTEDGNWHQVLLPDGTKGWIATPTQGGSAVYLGFGDIDGVPIIGAAEGEVPQIPSATPVVPPPSSATGTPVMPPPSSATGTPVMPPPSSATATPVVPPPSSATPTLEPTVTALPEVVAALARRLETWNVRQISEQLRLGTDSMAEMAWSPEGRYLAVASDNRIMVYEAGDLRASPIVLEGHTQPVIGLAYNPTGTLLASSSKDGTVRLWDAQEGNPLRTLRICDLCDVDRVSFNPDGSVLIIEADNDVQLWGLSQQ